MELEILPEYTFVLQAVTTGPATLFVTGKAGTGKSTLVDYLVSNLENCAVVAPTAIAALNVGGTTIHSFFGLPPRTFNTDEAGHPKRENKDVMRALKVLIVDEVSMVTPDMVDAMSNTLRAVRGKSMPFGGVSVVFVGDLLQLPPVINDHAIGEYYAHHYRSPYFYSAICFAQTNLMPVELTKVFRQKDTKFVEALDRLRTGTNPAEVLPMFNSRAGKKPEPGSLNLMTTNANVQAMNTRELCRLPTPLMTYEGECYGEFEANASRLPAPKTLQLKVGAQVLFVRNDTQGQWVNGTIGEVVELEENEIRVKIFEDGRQVQVGREEWKQMRYTYNQKLKRIEHEEVGEYVQFPLTLGWAVTIHKSQGMTLNSVHIDMGRGAFCTGQTYVALSRCRTLDGITLCRCLALSDIQVDGRVAEFYRQMAAVASGEALNAMPVALG